MVSDSLPFDSSKPKYLPSDQITKAFPDRSPWSSKTPEKPANPPPRRLRNCRAAMSVKEVREVAMKLQSSSPGQPHQLDPVVPDEQQIGSASGNAPARKSKRKVDKPIEQLPQKHGILVRFFDSLDSSIRLLRLKGSASTFINISPKVECLTDRRFSYGHLAQLKFILPEVIEIKKTLVHDEQTSCMKPDLHVSMNVDAIKDAGKLISESGNSHVRKVFRARLLDFLKAHPQGEVPEATLPEPFSHTKSDLQTSTTKASSSSFWSETSAKVLEKWEPAVSSHLSQSFQKHFSRHVSNSEAVHNNQRQSVASLHPSVIPVPELHLDQNSNEGLTTTETAPPSISKFLLKPSTHKSCSSTGTSEASATSSHLPATPVKERDYVKNEICSSAGTATIERTPAKLVSTPLKLMSTTPTLQPPKRCHMSPDDNSTSSPSKLFTRPPRSRSLKFDTPVKNPKLEDEVSSARGVLRDNDIFEMLPENLLQSIREKERKALEDEVPAISQARKRKKMIAGLPKLFDMIRFLFQSINRSIITKEELLHRILSGHLDIVDRREVEEQLEFLQKLVPEWIYEKLTSSGDLLICMNKISSAESIRSRLMDGNLTPVIERS